MFVVLLLDFAHTGYIHRFSVQSQILDSCILLSPKIINDKYLKSEGNPKWEYSQ